MPSARSLRGVLLFIINIELLLFRNIKLLFLFRNIKLLLFHSIVEIVIMCSFYGLQKLVSTDIFWIEHDSLELHATRYVHTTSYLDLLHTD